MMADRILKIAIPKGSLEEATLALFARSGWKIAMQSRNYFPEVNDPELSVSLCRPQEMGAYIGDGILDAGLTGKDWAMESGADYVVAADLIYSKMSNRPARWVLAVAGDSPYRRPQDLAGKRVATEIMGLTRRYFAERGIEVTVNYSWGATEAKVVEGLADAVVEVTETGTTIRAHGLRIIDEVLETNTQFIAGKAAWADPWKREKINQITMLLQGALRAESLVGVKMNVPAGKLDAVLALVPSLNSPTVSHLHDKNWLSLEIVIETKVVRDLVPRLAASGAEGIIEYPLNKVI
ncbi:MAG: ATP phosphoribosyltransferase [Desulfovibrio sp.]|nr:ATP phosphoribosyltransferase [Desulfovibrio sp.]